MLSKLINDDEDLDAILVKNNIEWPLHERDLFSQSGFVNSLTEDQAAALNEYFNEI